LGGALRCPGGAGRRLRPLAGEAAIVEPITCEDGGACTPETACLPPPAGPESAAALALGCSVLRRSSGMWRPLEASVRSDRNAEPLSLDADLDRALAPQMTPRRDRG